MYEKISDSNYKKISNYVLTGNYVDNDNDSVTLSYVLENYGSHKSTQIGLDTLDELYYYMTTSGNIYVTEKLTNKILDMSIETISKDPLKQILSVYVCSIINGLSYTRFDTISDFVSKSNNSSFVIIGDISFNSFPFIIIDSYIL